MYYCKKCNGTNIDVKAWVNQVTNNIEYSDYYENQDVYCLDCEESFGVYYKPSIKTT